MGLPFTTPEMSENELGKRPSKIKSLLALLRIPNIFTVPGDVVMGAVFAVGFTVLMPYVIGPVVEGPMGGIVITWQQNLLRLILSSMFLYEGGLVLNDFFDYKEDIAERPERPIPSGGISRTSAGVLGFVLLASGVGVAALVTPCSLYVALIIAALVLLYNGGAKHVPVLGEVVMGGARSCNVMLGATAGATIIRSSSLIAAPSYMPIFLVFVIGEGVYIALVTSLARIEQEDDESVKLMRYLPAAAFGDIAIALTAVGYVTDLITKEMVVVICVLALLGILGAILAKSEMSTRKLVGSYIGGLIFFQSAVILSVSFDNWPVALLVFALWPCGKFARRYFSAS